MISHSSNSKSIRKGHRFSPSRLTALGYALLIVLGALLLKLPQATHGGISFIDALFTSASAVCVTGLAVVDTGTCFTLLGKLAILGLIQVGGMGIMILSTLFVLSMGKRVSMTGKMMIQDTYNHGAGKSVYSLIRDVVVFTLIIEIIGALMLLPRFYPQMNVDQAVFAALFHAVSAFCNAGFSLFSDSFTRFSSDWIVNLTLCALILLGGIGFIVMAEVRQTFSFSKRAWSDLSLHTKLTLTSTLILVLGSTLVFFLLEWSNTLKGLPLNQQLCASFFQAVNTRTAGFNSLEIGNLANETLFISIILMFIGTAPGSCGGGVKVTTISSLVILGTSRFLGRPHPQIFYRRISGESISRATSLIMISMVIIVIGVICLQQVEIGDVSHTLSRGRFLEIFYEVVSAFGTVGLSTGITPDFSTAGKLILVVLMFIGRLGPLAIALALGRRPVTKPFSYAQENIMIG